MQLSVEYIDVKSILAVLSIQHGGSVDPLLVHGGLVIKPRS